VVGIAACLLALFAVVQGVIVWRKLERIRQSSDREELAKPPAATPGQPTLLPGGTTMAFPVGRGAEAMP
jgi:hypothetical protein